MLNRHIQLLVSSHMVVAVRRARGLQTAPEEVEEVAEELETNCSTVLAGRMAVVET